MHYLEHVGLPVSWFVNSTNIKNCEIKPGIEKKSNENGDPWLVSNYTRDNAYQIHRSNPNDPSTVRYGGTMPDSDVLSYATALKNAGKKVAFYPMLMVDKCPLMVIIINGKIYHVGILQIIGSGIRILKIVTKLHGFQNLSQ